MYTAMEANEYDFMRFISTFGKSYATKEEYETRYNLYKANLAIVNEHNS